MEVRNHRSEKGYLLEVCVDTVASAQAAEAGGAGRIELCSSLNEGGLTPSAGLTKVVKSKMRIPVFTMIRPRAGNFIYDEDEMQIMEEDIKILKASGTDGYVFGVLNDNGLIDSANCLRLLSLAAPLPCTFHRAYDFVEDPFQALEEIINLGFDRILTSGQKYSAVEGLELINSLSEIAGNRIKIMPGAGVTPTNIGRILSVDGITEVHGSFRKKTDINMEGGRFVRLGSTSNEVNIYSTDRMVVEAVIAEMN